MRKATPYNRQMSELHVVAGATGALGSAIVQQLCAEGLPVRALIRNRALAESMLPDGVELVEFDAIDAGSVKAICADASHVYHCVYSPDKLEHVASALAVAARDAKARLIFPSNADVYGPPQATPMTESHPLNAVTERGKWRASIEQSLYDLPDLDFVLLRLGTMYGAHIRGTFMSVIFESVLKDQKTFWLGALNAANSLVYVPDVAAAAVLLARAANASGQSWHIAHPDPLTGEQFMSKVWTHYGKTPNYGLRSATLFKVVGALVPDARRLSQVLYQFEKPFVLSSAKFAERFPSFEFTPHDVGVQDTVDWFKDEYGN
jgi:nucleoside-diphosphate-sugar epimerase